MRNPTQLNRYASRVRLLAKDQIVMVNFRETDN
jgi:hypothetical protein